MVAEAPDANNSELRLDQFLTQAQFSMLELKPRTTGQREKPLSGWLLLIFYASHHTNEIKSLGLRRATHLVFRG